MRDTVFSPAFGNKPGTLVGRSLELNSLTEGLEAMPGSRERAKLIIGQRGLGKTVLLLELADYGRKHGYIVASPTVVSGDMLHRILEKLERDGADILNTKKTKITGGSVGILGFSAGIQSEPVAEPERSFAWKLLDLCEAAEAAGKGILILVDEIKANNEDLKKLIIAYQEMVGEGKNIAVVFAGLPAAVSQTLNDHVLTFFNRASKMFLTPISQTEIELYYTDSFQRLGIHIPKEWIETAAGTSEGSPYMMQLIGHFITLSAGDDGELTEEKFRNALSLARKDYIRDICETTLSPLSERDIDFLRAMSPDEGTSAIRDLCERLHVEQAYVQRYKNRLMQAGIITQKRRGYVEYAVPYLRTYFLTQAPDLC